MQAIWRYAGDHGFVTATKDEDVQRLLALG
jgi:hypothetical protein